MEVKRVASNVDLAREFFSELRKYNITNFKTAAKAELTNENITPVIHKAFSSVVTRYFIFIENHPEITDVEQRMLYYKLKIDMIARYFSIYPDVDVDLLKPFQYELNEYIEDVKAKRRHYVKTSQIKDNKNIDEEKFEDIEDVIESVEEVEKNITPEEFEEEVQDNVKIQEEQVKENEEVNNYEEVGV